MGVLLARHSQELARLPLVIACFTEERPVAPPGIAQSISFEPIRARSRLRPGAARATRAGVRDGTSFRRTIGLGAVTVISGSCVEDEGVAASSAIALLPIAHSMSQLAPPRWTARLLLNFIVPILIPSNCDGPISIYPLMDRPHVMRRSPQGASINRCQEAGGARDWNAGRSELK